MGFWAAAIPAIASLAGGALSANAAGKAADTSAAGQAEANRLQMQQYADTMQRLEPWRKSGVAAQNFQNAWLGLPQVADTVGANGNGLLNGLAGGGTAGGYVPYDAAAAPKGTAPSLSASITGHDPSLYNAVANGKDLGEWFVNGGPSVSHAAANKITDSLGLPKFTDPLGLFRTKAKNAFDVWGTMDQNAARAGEDGYDYQAYYDANPDFAPHLEGLKTSDPRGYRDMLQSFDFDRNGQVDPAEFGQWHYQNAGKNEGRSIQTMADTQTAASNAAAAATPQYANGLAAGNGTASGTGATNIWDTIHANPLWKAATDGWSGTDGVGGTARAMEQDWSARGKVGSGAAAAARQLAGNKMAYGALADIYNQYGGVSGTGFTATNNLANQGQTTANNVGNGLANIANTRASGYQNQYDAYGRGVTGAIDSFSNSDWAKKNGWGV